MSKSTKVEVVKVKFKPFTNENLNFANLLTSERIGKEPLNYKGKQSGLEILENNNLIILGIVTTTQIRNIPPKLNRKTRKTSALQFESDESLAYANIFLYERKRGILLYEFNRNGCFLKQFRQLIYDSLKTDGIIEDDLKCDIDFQPILKKDEYERVLRMTSYKSFEIDFAHPLELISLFQDKNEALQKNDLYDYFKSQINLGVISKSDSFKIVQNASQSKDSALSSTVVKNIMDFVRHKFFLSSQKENISKFTITGYLEDQESNCQEPIDLVGDILKGRISLSEARLHSDLQITERKSEIKNLYSKLQVQLNAIFGLN